ncbi:DNA excision repair protein ERCC-1 isoform X2 [Durio zibethinus]|uniref:DNA excision repair protein ERCC-1 isoform X2 n=1 Tax=Durio zibethinus TaxID=66656 RepID=A0A6P5Z4I2_DURZI|nr:DNA excision repair protein ERCC-1 isoform X2 [Durio zibethinus]
MEEERENQAEQNQSKKKTPIVIGIPSYKEVIESSQMKSTPPSLFTPSHSFSQAFSFIKSSEFYSPPPQPPPATTSTVSTPRPIGEANVPSSSSSAASTSASPAAAVASSSSNSAQNRNAILVSHRQKGNPLLKHIRNVRWAFADIICDYLLGQNSCALYLSLRYHLLHPDYLYYRIRELQKNFKLRVVLCHVDVEDVVKPLLEVTKTALLHDCTLLCGWSLEECGRYLETIKVYENKPADLIQGQMDTDYLSRSLSSIMDASMEDLARCPGIGERKVKRLYDAFHEPFKRVVSSNPHVPETPVCNDAEPCSASEVIEAENDTENTSKRRKKEPEMNVKSALTAAFAKYSGKISKKNNKSEGSKGGGTSATVASEAATKNSKEGV